MGAHRPGETGTLRKRRRRVRSHLVLACSKAIRRAKTVGLEPQRGGQHGQLLGDQGAKRPERGLGLKPGTHRPHLGDAPGERLGEQPDDDAKDVMDQTHPALDPAHRPRELDRIAAKRIGCRGQARGPLGVDHHPFDLVQLPGKPCGQTLRQQAEGGVALRAVPTSDTRPARGLARVGAVAGQRTAPVQVIGAALKGCIAPRLGPNVCLAGKPRLVAKLHRPWPGGVCPPRGPTPLSFQGASRLRLRPSRRQLPTMWTRPSDRAPPCGPCGQAMEKLRFPTACPHSALSRPQPRRCRNNNFSERHRLQPVPRLLRHPRKSDYGTVRQITGGIPRPIARNNSMGRDRRRLVAVHALHPRSLSLAPARVRRPPAAAESERLAGSRRRRPSAVPPARGRARVPACRTPARLARVRRSPRATSRRAANDRVKGACHVIVAPPVARVVAEHGLADWRGGPGAWRGSRRRSAAGTGADPGSGRAPRADPVARVAFAMRRPPMLRFAARHWVSTRCRHHTPGSSSRQRRLWRPVCAGHHSTASSRGHQQSCQQSPCRHWPEGHFAPVTTAVRGDREAFASVPRRPPTRA